MNRTALIQEIRRKKTYLCIGLDTDITKLPKHVLKEQNPVLTFNKAIIDATHDLCVSYKINTAFYEAMGSKGWDTMQETLRYIPKDIFTIADAKRGDIGNTSLQYAKAFFETMSFDSITVAPYMGKDSISPFLQFKNKWAIVLALTSNEGAYDFQYFEQEGNKLFEEVLRKVSSWGTDENLMFVIGATKTDQLAQVRDIIPNHFLLIPGVGTQGGSLSDVSRIAMNKDIGLLINVSRQIIYASSGEDFAEAARAEAQKIQTEMASFLNLRY